jgi:hypothetical protein
LVRAKIEKRLAELQKADMSGLAKKSTLVDLLTKIDLPKDAIAGNWKFVGGALVGVTEGAHARLQINYTPPEEYDLTVVAERRDGSEDLEIGLIGGGRQFVVAFDVAKSTWSGPAWIDGKTVNENGIGVQGKFFDQKKPRTIVCMVRKDSLTIRADGKDFITWKADWSRVSIRPEVSVPSKSALSLIICTTSTYAISKMVLTPPKVK